MALEIKEYPCHDHSYVTREVCNVEFNPKNRATSMNILSVSPGQTYSHPDQATKDIIDQLSIGTRYKLSEVPNSDGEIEYHLANTDAGTMRKFREGKYLDIAIVDNSAKTIQALSGGDTIKANLLGSHDGWAHLRSKRKNSTSRHDDGDTATLDSDSAMDTPDMSTPTDNSLFYQSELYDGPRPKSGAAQLKLKYSAAKDSTTGLMNYKVESVTKGPGESCYWHDTSNFQVLQHTFADNAFNLLEEYLKSYATNKWALKMRTVRNPSQINGEGDSAKEMYNFTITKEMKKRIVDKGEGSDLEVTVDVSFAERDQGRDNFTEPLRL